MSNLLKKESAPTDVARHKQLPHVAVEQLDHVIHAMRMTGELAQLTIQQTTNIIHAMQAAGCQFKPEPLDHVIHAMAKSGQLAQLTAEQLTNIVYALNSVGHHITDTRDATYNDGRLLSFFNADFLKDPRFAEANRLARATNSWGGDIPWRVYVVCWAAAHARNLQGDFVECGVNRGGFSRAIMHYIDFNNVTGKNFFLLDTYCGIPTQDRHSAAEGCNQLYGECYEEVCKTFQPFPNARIIRGRVPDTLTQVNAEKVCYLSIDMNCVEPEIAAAEFFWDKLVPGALIVLDDYGAGPAYMRQKHAFDCFAAKRGVQVLTLPTCQGLLVKP